MDRMFSRRDFLRIGVGIVGAVPFLGVRRLLAEETRIEEPIEKARRILLAHYRKDVNGNLLWNGNGFVLGDKYLTAYHLLDNLETGIKVKNPFVYSMALEEIAVSAREDTALFQIPHELGRVRNDYALDKNVLIYKGQEIFLYNFGLEYSAGERILKGRITDVSCAIPNDYLNTFVSGYVCFEGAIELGDSGSPVFDAKTGDVLGVVTNKQKDNSGYGYFEPIWKFSWLLEDRIRSAN